MPTAAKTMLLTATAMLAFAANSLLCRLALGQELIDAASFTAIRVASGATMLGLIMLPAWRASGTMKADWRAVAALLAYMIFFSFAYVSLEAGTGALLLFGAVQLTMFVAAWRGGERFGTLSWIGLILAVFGLTYLVSPGVTAPNLTGAGLMAVAGVAWGLYSLLGRHVADPLQSTAVNFIYAVPGTLLVSFASAGAAHASWNGMALAAASGGIASGLGYIAWYAALRGLAAGQAATVQLSVPVIAALGGVALLSEQLTPRLVIASLATLAGVAIVLTRRSRRPAAV
jgi:drug/metabolite transporter (DMT)-like permease